MDYEIWIPNSTALGEMNFNDINIVRRDSFIVNINVDDALSFLDKHITEQSEQDKYLERIGAK